MSDLEMQAQRHRAAARVLIEDHDAEIQQLESACNRRASLLVASLIVNVLLVISLAV